MGRKTLSQTLIDNAKIFGFKKTTVDQLESLGIPEVRNFTPRDIIKLREKIKVSQGVFAALLNVNPSTVQKWEQGKVSPQKSALRLLSIIYSHGIDVLLK